MTEGRLIVEFTFDDMMRVRTWHFAIRQFKELIPRSVIAMQVRARVRHRCAGACAKLSLNFQSVDTIMDQQVDNHSFVILCVFCLFTAGSRCHGAAVEKHHTPGSHQSNTPLLTGECRLHVRTCT